ncbi:MAG: hypothetical protein GMKNLPBB_01083 [Myxococcota bacterium]|nr:hypothetical protein [Myxococcota bacterium]
MVRYQRRMLASVVGLTCLLAAVSAFAQKSPPVLTIEEALVLARKNNPAFPLLEQKVTQANARIDKAWAFIKPNLTWQGTFTHTSAGGALDPAQSAIATIDTIQNLVGDSGLIPASKFDEQRALIRSNSQPIEIVRRNSFGMNLVLRQPLFNGLSIPLIKNEYDNLEMQKLTNTVQERKLLRGVVETYYQLVTAERQLKIQESSLIVRKEHLRVAEARLAGGIGAKLDVIQARAAISAVELEITRTRAGIDQARAVLANLIGGPAEFSTKDPNPVPPVNSELPTLVQSAIANRDELKSLDFAKSMANRLDDVAWMKFVPSLDFTGLLRGTDTPGFQGDNFVYQLVFTLTIPLYDGGTRYADLKDAESRIVEANEAVRNQRIEIEREVTTAWLNWIAMRNQIRVVEEQVKIATETVEAARAQYEAGVITSLEVVDATDRQLQAEMGLNIMKIGAELALFKLSDAIGTWRP